MNWKAKPADKSKTRISKSIEIQIMLLCNWACQACDQFSQFPSISFVKRATMTEGQIEHFIKEMRDNNAYIGRIRLVGGEPSAHPKFEGLVKMLHAGLVATGHIGQIEVVTNGSKQERIVPLKPYIEKVRISDEKDKQRTHVANLAATPAELGYPGTMCSAPWHCGFSLNYYGYFPCSSGAGIARMRDWMVWQRLALPVEGVMAAWPNLQELCNHCYHGLKDEHKVRCGTAVNELNAPSKDAWSHLGPWLAGKQPAWPVYGEAK